MSIKVMSFYWDQTRLRGNELLCMLALSDWANNDGECWPSVTSLAARIRVSRRGAFGILKRLEEKGEIARISDGGRPTNGGITNKYLLLEYIKGSEAGLTTTPLKGSEASFTGGGEASFTGGGEATARGSEASFMGGGEAASSTDPSVEPLEPSLEPSGGETREREMILIDIPVTPPSPPANGRHGRSRKNQNIDPRKIGDNGLIPSGHGTTVLEIYREGFTVSPTAFQIQNMNAAVTDLEKWRQTVHECAARGFRTVANVVDVYQHGFREKSSNGYRNNNQTQFLAARNNGANSGRGDSRGAGTAPADSNGSRKRTQWSTPAEFRQLDPEIQQFLIAAKRRDPEKYADVPDL